MMLSPRVDFSFVVLIYWYIFLCQKISNANLLNTSIGLNVKQGNNIEQHENTFRNISDENFHASGRKTSSSHIGDNRGVNKAKIGSLKFWNRKYMIINIVFL